MAGQPRECPTGLDDQLVEDRVGLENGAETRLYKPDDSRFALIALPTSRKDLEKGS